MRKCGKGSAVSFELLFYGLREMLCLWEYVGDHDPSPSQQNRLSNFSAIYIFFFSCLKLSTRGPFFCIVTFAMQGLSVPELAFSCLPNLNPNKITFFFLISWDVEK